MNQSTTLAISDLISFIWQQEDYQKSLSELDHHEFQQMILELWKYLADKYENSFNKQRQKNLAKLAEWIVFARELNDTYTNLVLKSCKHFDKPYSTHELLKNLVAIKNNGNPNTTAKSIGEIIASLSFKDYMACLDQDFIKVLVSFLFAHGQNQIAAEFCNKLASVHQQLFLREIYEANVSK